MKYFSYIFVALFLSSCSWLSFGDEQLEEVEVKSNLSQSGLAQSKRVGGKPPVEISILSVKNIDGKLLVDAELKPLTDIPSRDVTLALFGLKGGVVVESDIKNLAELLGDDELEAEIPRNASFSIPSAEITDYQVKCSWGEEAKELASLGAQENSKIALPASSEPVDDSLLEEAALADDVIQLDDVVSSEALEKVEEEEEVVAKTEEQDSELKSELQIDESTEEGVSLASNKIEKEFLSCEDEPCDYQYIFHGTLINNSNEPLESLKLAVGLFWENEGDIAILPEKETELTENEELVELENLAIGPKTTKPLKIKIDRTIPQIPGGSFVPNIRIINSEINSSDS